MDTLQSVVIITVGVVLLATAVMPRPTGAPNTTCSAMTPGHGTESILPQPYSISVGAVRYEAGSTITVSVSGPTFRGILMQVRKAGSPLTDTLYGAWSNLPTNTRLLTCTNTGDSVTHENPNTKQNVTFTWTAPQGVTEDLHVIATVAQERVVWWKGVRSATITYDGPVNSTSTHIGLTATCSVLMAMIVAVLILRFY